MDALQQLDVWKRSCRLSVDIYKMLSNCREYCFRQQVTSAALSIPSNIAEGYERDSNRERARYCRIAKGSCGELWTQLWIGLEAGFVDPKKGRELVREVEEISKMLHGLITRFTQA